MSIELENTKSFEGSIDNGTTEQIEIQAARSDYVQVMLDDGTTGNDPPQYTLTQEYYQSEVDDYMEYSTATGQTSKSLRENCRGSRILFTFENTSGASATFRIVVSTFREV